MTHDEIVKRRKRRRKKPPAKTVDNNIDASRWTRLAWKVTNRHTWKSGNELDELYAAALLGLFKASKSYDPEHIRHASFMTYSWKCMVNAIKNYRRNEVMARQRTWTRKRYGCDPRKVTVKTHLFSECGAAFVNGSDPVFAVEGNVVINSDVVYYRELIEDAMQFLPPRRQTIMRMRFGLYDGVTYTLREIGLRLHINQENVRQQERKGIEKLRIRIKTALAGGGGWKAKLYQETES